MQLTQRPPSFRGIKFPTLSLSRLQVIALAGLGIVMGVALAYLIAHDHVVYAVFLSAAIPLGLLLLAYPFAGIVLWLLVMPFVAIIPNSEMVYWALYRVMPPLLLIMVLISRALKVRSYPAVRIGLAEFAMIGMMLLVLASIYLSHADTYRAIIAFGDRIAIPFSMYLLIRLLAPREKDFYILQLTSLFIIYTQALIGFLSWFAPQTLPSVWLKLQGHRTTGSLMDADLYATLLTFCAVLLIQGAIHQKSRWIRFIYFASSGVSALFIFLSLERAAWLAGVFVLIGLVGLFPRVMFRLILIGIVAAGLLGTGLLSTHFSLSANRLGDTEQIYDRFVIMDAMAQMFQLKPVFGWGYETLDLNITHFYRRVGEGSITRTPITSHNTYMTIITELGLVGIVLYLFPIYWWLILSKKVWPLMRKNGLWSQGLLGVLWLAWFFNFTVSNFIDMRYFPIGISLWWMVLGLIANMVFPYLDGQKPLPVRSTLPEHPEA